MQKLLRATVSTLLFLLLLSIETVLANPLPQSEQLKPKPQTGIPKAVNWKFSFYGNLRCTGTPRQYSGWTSTASCEKAVLDGGVPSYRKNVMKEGCIVTLYSDNDCKTGIGEITEVTKLACQMPQIMGRGKKIRSFQVHC